MRLAEAEDVLPLLVGASDVLDLLLEDAYLVRLRVRVRVRVRVWVRVRVRVRV